MYEQPVPVGTFTQQRPNYGGVPDALILSGAAVGIAMTSIMMIVFVIQFFVFREVVNQSAGPEYFPSFVIWMPILFGVLGLIALVGAILAFLARAELKRTNGERGSTRAIVAGAIMIAGMGMLGGVLVLIGGILASQNQPRRT